MTSSSGCACRRSSRRDGITVRRLRDRRRRRGLDVFANDLGPHFGEVAGDEMALPLDLQLGDLGPAAFLLIVGEFLAVLRTPGMEHTTRRRIDRARQIAGEQ